MTQEEIKEYNKMCAEFLGYTNPISDKDFYFVDKKDYDESSKIPKLLELNFENRFINDFNWIMEMVEGIEKVNFTKLSEFSCFSVVIKDNTCEIEQHPQFSLAFKELSNSFHNSNSYVISKSKKEAVAQAINQFLIWHKTQKL